MTLLARLYKARGLEPPYWALHPLWLLAWKPVRKFLNVVVIPCIPFTRLRELGYRLLGYKFGRHVFIGMRCYLDDLSPSKTIIGNNVTVSYGTYFAAHGIERQTQEIRIGDGTYIGMRCTIIAGKEGTHIGSNCLIGAGSLVNQSIPDNAVAVGVPARVIRYSDTILSKHEARDRARRQGQHTDETARGDDA